MNKILRILSFIMILVAAALVFTSELPRLILDGDIDRLQELASDHLGSMLLVTLLIMLLQNLVTVVPLVLLVTVNTALFGFIYGFVWSWLSSVIAATVVFCLTRYWLQDLLMRKVNESIRERIAQNGWMYVLVCRLIPVMPSSLINMAAGVSTIRLIHFVFATLIGNLLFMSALAAVMFGILQAGWEAAVLVIVALAAAGSFYMVRRRRRSVLHAQRSFTQK